MRYSRSHRRHHYARLKAKWFKEERARASDSTSHAIIERNVYLRTTTACLCSCWMCGNPRRRYGNSKASLTRRELKAGFDTLTDD